MSLVTDCVQSMKSVYSAISTRVGDQERADSVFEKHHLIDRTAPEGDRVKIVKLMERVGSSKNPIDELKKIYKPKKLLKILVVKPLRALALSVVRATLFISTPFVILSGLGLSIYRRSWKDLTDSVGDLAQLIRLFIRGVFKIVPIVGPLLARGWSVLNAVVSIGASKVADCIKSKAI